MIYIKKHQDGDCEYISADDIFDLFPDFEWNAKAQKIYKFLNLVEEYLNYFNDSSSTAFGNPDYTLRKAKAEAAQILKEFSEFYRGDIGIVIEPKFHGLCWSITGTLMVNGEPVRTEDPCDLLFLSLNNLMLNRMLQLGIPSFGR